MAIKIITDSSCDLRGEILRERDLSLIPFMVSLDNGETFIQEIYDISIPDFYKAERDLAERDPIVYPRTSMPSMQAYIDVMKPILERGDDIICLSLSSKFSGSFQSNVNAAETMREEYPGRKIASIDSFNASGGQGALVLEACRMRDLGMAFEDITANIERIREDSVIYFTMDSMSYLQKGGRSGKSDALGNNLNNIRPIVAVKDGEMQPVANAKGRKQSMIKIVEMLELFSGDKKDNYEYFIIHSDVCDDAAALKEMLAAKDFNVTLPIIQMGTTIGTHLGFMAVGAGCLRKFDK